jgi:hypothetical protein
MKSLTSLGLSALLLTAAGLPLLAQGQGQDETPAVPAEPAAPAHHHHPKHSAPAAGSGTAGTGVAAGSDETPGTTLIGDRESPLGLYLTPWKNEYAERGMDRPPQNFQESMTPVDPKVLDRQRDYYDAIVIYRQGETGSQK